MLNERVREKLEFNLQFFAKDGPGGERTEKPTVKKLNDAREEGKVAKSKEVSNAIGLITLFVVLKVYVGSMGTKFLELFDSVYDKIPETVDYAVGGVSINSMMTVNNSAMYSMIMMCLPVLLIGMVGALVSDVIQVKWKPTLKPLKPKFSKLNPISGFKKIFSKDALFELIKSILKIGVVCFIAYKVIEDDIDNLLLLYDMPLKQAIVYVGGLAIDVGLIVAIVYVVVAVIDFAFQKFRFNQEMMMTKQEIKEEFKNTEGNPEIKGRQRQRMREASQRRMMQDLKTADVVITNPTHLAVALKYDAEAAKKKPGSVSTAPVVVAKGEDYLAQKIKEEARANNIEIVENKPLARQLYANVEIGQEIPPELYQAVAEVLAYIYGLKNR